MNRKTGKQERREKGEEKRAGNRVQEDGRRKNKMKGDGRRKERKHDSVTEKVVRGRARHGTGTHW